MFLKLNTGQRESRGKALYVTPLIPVVSVTSQDPNNNSVVLNWPSDSNTQNWDVYYKLSSSGTWSLGTSGLSVSSWNSISLTAGEIYDFRVDANNANGTVSGYLYAQQLYPDPPSNFASSNVGTTSLDLTWTAAFNATDYEIDYKETAAGTWNLLSNGITGTTYNATGLNSGTSYDFRIRSNISGVGYSEYSEISESTEYLPAGQVTAANLTFIPSTESISCSWSNTANSTSYNLEWRLSPSGSVTNITGVTSSYNLTGLDDEITYDIRINAVNPSGITLGEWDTVTTDQSTPTAPTNIQISQVATNSMRVGWDASSEEPDYYNVWQRDVTGAGSWTEVGTNITQLFYDATGLAANNEYEFYVVAWNEAGNSTNSATNGASTNPLAPSAPINLNATSITKTSLTLNWESGGGVVNNYEVEYKQTSSGTWLIRDNNVAGTSIGFTGLVEDTSYDFRVRAVNGTGSSTSGVYTVSTLGVIAIRPQSDAITSGTWTSTPYWSKLSDQSDGTIVTEDGSNSTMAVSLGKLPQIFTAGEVTLKVRYYAGAGSSPGDLVINVRSEGGTSYISTTVAIASQSIQEVQLTNTVTMPDIVMWIEFTRAGGGNPGKRQHAIVAEAWLEY
jgi:hypothetical protein